MAVWSCAVAAILAVTLAEPASSAELGEAAVWTTAAPLPIPRGEAPMVEADGYFYSTAGANTDPLQNYDYKAIHRYDPVTNRWELMRSRYPFQSHHVGAVSIGSKIYWVGSQSAWGMDATVIYDTLTDTIRLGARFPRPRGSGGMAVYKNRIFYVGGRDRQYVDPTTAWAWFDMYDPATNRWTQLPDMPRVRDHFSAHVIGDKLYVIGGRNILRGALIAQTDVSNFLTGRWETTRYAPIPTKRGGYGSVVINNEIWVFGGEVCCPNRVLGTVEIYNPTTNVWRTGPSLPVPIHGVGIAACGTSVHLVGGSITHGQNVGSASRIHQVVHTSGTPVACRHTGPTPAPGLPISAASVRSVTPVSATEMALGGNGEFCAVIPERRSFVSLRFGTTSPPT